MARVESVPASELTAADFQRHTVWQFALDSEQTAGTDESHVSPAKEALSLGTYGSFLVAATIGLKDGQELPGAVQADFMGKKVHFTPLAIYARGKSLDPLDSNSHSRLARLMKTSKAKPIAWRLNTHLVGESSVRRGRISQSTFVRTLRLLVQLISLRFAR
jgi:hypothetical protein